MAMDTKDKDRRRREEGRRNASGTEGLDVMSVTLQIMEEC
jgi:hypothetical protein